MTPFAAVTYVRIYADETGQSHLEDLALAVTSEDTDDTILGRTEPFAASAISFVVGAVDWDYGWHNAPRRQFVLLLSGRVEIETSDGDIRQLDPGAVILAEDTSGRGHITRGIGESPVVLGIVPLTVD